MKRCLFVLAVFLVSLCGCYFGDPNYFNSNWIDYSDYTYLTHKDYDKYFDTNDYEYLFEKMNSTQKNVFNHFNNISGSPK